MSGHLKTIKEAAKQYGSSEQWIRSLCRRGKIKAVKLGREWIILEEVKK